MCLYPRMMINKKYQENGKNGGQIPQLKDERTIFVPIGCGNCIECRKQKARAWQVRLLEDIKDNKNGKFITLTFSDKWIAKLREEIPIEIQGYNLDNQIATLAMRRFNERWRKRYGIALRHWMITELGHEGTQNIHLHGIIWTDRGYDRIRQLWKYGWIWPNEKAEKTNYVTARTVNYIIKYVTKVDEIHTGFKSKVLTSPGIGRNYIGTYNAKKNSYNKNGTRETYKTSTGHNIALPIYWRNKIYTEEEREKLWIEKLDKQVRWVNGVKVDISQGEEEYKKVLKTAQEANKKLKYGSSERDWKKEEYEQELRALKQATRIAKGRNAFGGKLNMGTD